MKHTILVGDVRERLADIPDGSVQCVVTSPPYFALRNYDESNQIGLEPSVAEYVAALVRVFREVRRVLCDDGTAWVVLGDSYNTYAGNRSGTRGFQGAETARPAVPSGYGLTDPAFKNKDLFLAPARVAMGLQDDGWYLRKKVVWHKPNAMPESVKDRPTCSHEEIYLLSKRSRYYYDREAIAEPSISTHDSGNGYARPASISRGGRGQAKQWSVAENPTRNKRDVWTVNTVAFRDAHFATFPPKLVEPMILAGCPEGGMVLDPFGGAGTVSVVCDGHGRDSTLIELNPEYAEMARRRICAKGVMFTEVTVR